MTYADLKNIVKYLKKEMPCGYCKKKFQDEDFTVVTTYETSAVMHFSCFHCTNQMLVHVEILEQTDSENRISVHAKNASQISKNDVLDIHNFLNQFNGDFKELFQK